MRFYEFRRWPRVTGRIGLLLPLAVAAVLSACAFGSSEVEPGPEPNTFRVWQVYAPARGGVPAARQVATEMALNKCAELDGEFYALEEIVVPYPPRYEVIFSCVNIGTGR